MRIVPNTVRRRSAPTTTRRGTYVSMSRLRRLPLELQRSIRAYVPRRTTTRRVTFSRRATIANPYNIRRRRLNYTGLRRVRNPYR